MYTMHVYNSAHHLDVSDSLSWGSPGQMRRVFSGLTYTQETEDEDPSMVFRPSRVSTGTTNSYKHI